MCQSNGKKNLQPKCFREKCAMRAQRNKSKVVKCTIDASNRSNGTHSFQMHLSFQCIRCIFSADRFFWRIHFSDNRNEIEVMKPWTFWCDSRQREDETWRRFQEIFFLLLLYDLKIQSRTKMFIIHAHIFMFVDREFMCSIRRSDGSSITWSEIKSPVTKSSVKKWAKEIFSTKSIRYIKFTYFTFMGESKKTDRTEPQMIASIGFNFWCFFSGERSFNCWGRIRIGWNDPQNGWNSNNWMPEIKAKMKCWNVVWVLEIDGSHLS